MWSRYIETYLGQFWQRYGTGALANVAVSLKWPAYKMTNIAKIITIKNNNNLGHFGQIYGTVSIG